jgi:hypothetical protein
MRSDVAFNVWIWKDNQGQGCYPGKFKTSAESL